ncbi:PAP22 [Symbiodinium natans]|uniref:Purple acid phosphatase n=1 Tax=Symbiodinium natans TaxID=878477 RepID=A0A812RG62_9DINO|nr:PAP22 [Symbiodinium natans]
MLLEIVWLCLAWSSDAFVPTQVSLAAGSHADSTISITWLTDDDRDDPTSCAEVAVVHVRGPIADQSEHARMAPGLHVVGTCSRYSLGSAPELFGNYTSGRIHTVQVNGLVAGSTYAYTLFGDSPSTTRHFKTLPASEEPEPRKADPRFPFVLGVIGDLGQTADSQETVRHLDADPSLQILLHAGDMAYADTESKRWDSYGLKVEPLSSRLQWMVCPGNHEIESDYYTGESFKAYEARFAMPSVQPVESLPSTKQIGCKHPFPAKPHKGPDCTPSVFSGGYDWGNSFYAFDAGPARVISLNSYANTGPQSAQLNWLREELEALARRRSSTPWLIVMMHCPFYSSNAAHHEERQTTLMRDIHGFEDLLQKHAAAVVISGHVHAYERTHPVYRNVTKPGAPTYIVVGDGGNREGHAKDYLPQPSWSAFRNGLTFGHGRLVIANKTHMQWEWWTNDDTLPPAMNKERAARRAADLELSGSIFDVDSPWRSPLPQRSAVDSVWIRNPYRDPPPRSRFANASLWALGLVSVSSAVLAFLVIAVQRCRRRRLAAQPVQSSQSINSAEMQSTSSSRTLLDS